MPANSRSCGCSRLRIISAMPNRPMAIGTKLMPSVMSGMPNVMRGAPGVHVDADQTDQHADDDHGDGLGRRAVREHDGAEQSEDDEADRLHRRELEGQRGQRQAQQRDHHRRHRAGEERGDGGDRQRRAGAALAGHLVAVDAGDDRGGLARHVDEDGGRRAAVLRAVEDAGQHDHGRRRRQAEREGQQHRHRGERRDARQHADQRADHHAGETEQQVLPARRRGEPERQVVEQLHRRPHQGQSWPGQNVGHTLNGKPSAFTNSSAENASQHRRRTGRAVPQSHRRRGRAGHQHATDAGGHQPERREQHRKQRDRGQDRRQRPPWRRRQRLRRLEQAGDAESGAEAEDDPGQRARHEARPHVGRRADAERAGGDERHQRQRDQKQPERQFLGIDPVQHGKLRFPTAP